MKANTLDAMSSILRKIRENVDLDAMNARSKCRNNCMGCPKKRLDSLHLEVMFWEAQLAKGKPPTLGDVGKLARAGEVMAAALEKNPVLCRFR